MKCISLLSIAIPVENDAFCCCIQIQIKNVVSLTTVIFFGWCTLFSSPQNACEECGNLLATAGLDLPRPWIYSFVSPIFPSLIRIRIHCPACTVYKQAAIIFPFFLASSNSWHAHYPVVQAVLVCPRLWAGWPWCPPASCWWGGTRTPPCLSSGPSWRRRCSTPPRSGRQQLLRRKLRQVWGLHTVTTGTGRENMF